VGAGRPTEGLAIAALVLAERDPGGRTLEDRRQAFLAIEERHGRDIDAIKLQQIEGEIDQCPAPLSEAFCIVSNDVTPSGRTQQSSPSIYAVVTGSFARAAAVARYLTVQSKPVRVSN
jgi:hypothetical protein